MNRIFKSIPFFAFVLVLSACNRKLDKKDICGVQITQDIDDSMGMKGSYNTIFNCDGKFESTYSKKMDDSHPVMSMYGEKLSFKGTWHIVTDVPKEVREAVIAYGKEDNNYTIIGYSSDNGVNGYCLFYDNFLAPLNTGEVSSYDWEEIRGAAGIFGGILRK